MFYAILINGITEILFHRRLEDYTLQVSGEESYIHGDCEIIAFRHIRKYVHAQTCMTI